MTFLNVTGVGSFGFKPQVSLVSEFKGEPKYIQKSVAPQYSLSYPRVNDSEGVIGESPLAKHLDLIS